MRILEVVADGSPGGGTTHVLQLLSAWQEADVVGLACKSDSYLSRIAATLKCQVFPCRFGGGRFDLRPVRDIRDAIRTFEPQIVHCHGLRGAFYCSLANRTIPSIYTVHGFHHTQKQWPIRQICRWAERRVISQASAVVFVCHSDHRLALRDRLLPVNVPFRVIHNGVADPGVACCSDRGGGLGFIGRHVEQKYPELFLDVLERLPDSHATMVGGGELFPGVSMEIARRGMQDRVKQVGEASHETALQHLSQMEAVLLTSRWEGLPLLVLEAMWLGVPVIATNVGGVGEMIADGVTGLIVDVGPGEGLADQFAQCVRRLNDDPELRSRIICNARQHVEEQFSPQAMIQSLREVYGSVLQSR